jgi:hypothetical protein
LPWPSFSRKNGWVSWKFRWTFAFDFRMFRSPRKEILSRSLIHFDVRAGYNGHLIYLFNGILACR